MQGRKVSNMSKTKITARIEKTNKPEALFLIVDRIGGSEDDLDNLKGLLDIRPDGSGNIAYAVLESELKVIRDAIDKYLKNKHD